MPAVKGFNAPLKIRIEHNELVIRVGIGTLAFCAERCQEFYDPERHDESKAHGHGAGPFFKIADPKVFAGEVIRALDHEQEDGTTPVHILFDEAFLAAYEDGAEGIEEIE